MNVRIDRVINKSCIIRKNGSLYAYCSKCGKMVMQDHYNMKKHGDSCGFRTVDFADIYREMEDFVYAWRFDEQYLYFIVYTPQLVLRPGFKDRYQGGQWKKVFVASFERNGKKIVEQGLHNLDYWISCIENKSTERVPMCSLNAVPDVQILRAYFPVIADIYSLKMFVEIYRNRGYAYTELLSESEAESLLREMHGKACRPFMMGMMKPDDDDVFQVDGRVVEYDNELVLVFHVCLGGRRDLGWRKMEFYGLVSEHYCYVPDPVDLGLLFLHPIECEIPVQDLQRFAEKYPSFGLKIYLEYGGKNVMIPLLGATYNSKLELFAKAGCSAIADVYMEKLKWFVERVDQASNVRDIFGLPVKVLRKLDHECMMVYNVFESLVNVWNTDPSFLNLPSLSACLCRFFDENRMLCRDEMGRFRQMNAIPEIAEASKEEMLRFFRYLGQPGRTQEDYVLYRDYMSMSRRIGVYVDGVRPKNIKRAHDEVLRRSQELKEKQDEAGFWNQTHKESYQALASDYGDEAERFSDDEYVIRVPDCPRELVMESAALHHCVRMYVPWVIAGDTRILFLRKKSKPKESFATLEVKGSRVIQLKAAFNHKAPVDAQRFVKRWAKVKRLRIDTADIVG